MGDSLVKIKKEKKEIIKKSVKVVDP